MAAQSPDASAAPSPTAASQPATADAPVVNYLESYRQRCIVEGCRVNSAVAALLKKNPGRPLQQLTLANNYVGPRGFKAVLHLIQECQTIDLVDLQSNGLDNAAVVSLCDVLQSHLGVTQLNLSGNPISLDAGHALMRLLQANRNIVECRVDNTDIFDALSGKLNDVAADNYERINGKRPQLAPARPLAMRPATSGGKSTAQGPPPRPARITSPHAAVLRSARKPETIAPRPPADGPPTATVSSSRIGSGAPTPHVASRSASAGTMRSTQSPQREHGHARIGDASPRPPVPAIASDYHARLTAEHREELRQRYRKRSEQFREVEMSQSKKVADQVRSELAALEAAQHRYQVQREAETASRVPRPPAETPQPLETTPTQSEERADAESQLTSPGRSVERPRNRGTQQRQRQPNDGDGSEEPTTPTSDSKQPATGASVQAPKATRFLIDGETTQPQRKPRGEQQPRPDASLAADMADPREADQQPAPAPTAQALVVGTDDQFKTLFNLGCRHYNEHNLDAAYQSWTEALTLATEEHNREWMALLSHNLQALSYEVLLNETNTNIDRNDLDGAEKTLGLAERVASKARNATWLTELSRVRQRVLMEQFKRHHESATERFDRLTTYQHVEVTDDDRYEENGVLIQHTGLYVNEWARMLLVKEAIESWAEATHRAKEIGGQQGRAMEEVVDSSVMQMCALLVDRYFAFDDESPSALTTFHTWGLSAPERQNLVDLWRDLATRARSLGNLVWSFIEQMQLGNLLFASHELSRATEHFSTALGIAQQSNDRFLTAAAMYCLGGIHYQRASYADAEAMLKGGVAELHNLRREMPAPSANVDEDAGIGSTSAGSGHVHSAMLRSPLSSAAAHNFQGPVDQDAPTWPTAAAATALHYRALYLLSRNLIGKHKYEEGLEMHERALVYAHCDVLHEKLTKNFNKPTMDHISCVAATMQAPLVYFAVHYRHEWNAESEQYDVLEHVYIWIVPAEGRPKFLLIDVHAGHRIDSVLHIIDRLRRTLAVQPNNEDTRVDPVASHLPADSKPQTTATAALNVITEVPELQWRTPLRTLFQILLRPIIDFIAANAQYSDQNGIVVIPHGFLWLTPFAALLNDDNKFVIQTMTVTHGLSATQLAFSALSWKSASENSVERRLVIGQPEAQASSVEPYLAFLSDAPRAEREAQHVASLLSAEIITGSSTDAVKIPTLLPRCRHLHVTAPVISDCSKLNMSGGLAATTSYDHLGILHSASVAFARTRTELAVMTNVNVMRNAVMQRREGSLGWMRTLLGCGVTSLVFPLWCTPDIVSDDFVDAFYSALDAADSHKSRALATAMRQMMVRSSGVGASGTSASDDDEPEIVNPRLWASYVVIGYPFPLQKKRVVKKRGVTSGGARPASGAISDGAPGE